MRRLPVLLATAALATVGLLPGTASALPPDGTGHSVGGCPVNGGWVLMPINPAYSANVLVDQVLGNQDGYLCGKDPGAPGGQDFVIDNVVQGAGKG